ncbi:MAG: hypothetical protein A3J74_10785 [Elusimicrobia bacterium RIFCSPHIGHO2_02_FULL_57_9]|nr:MAG: hypothetical protein A3J74_10785 [Elusimicrobia bacterium RIFCSPHIGHO2_02_FULL_57_9]
MNEGESDVQEEESAELYSPAIFDVVIYDSAKGLLDDKAKAHDLSPTGFQAETKLKLKEGSRIEFMVYLENGEGVKGQALISWVKPDQWGFYIAGARIVKIPWRQKRKLGRRIGTPYDFYQLAKLTVKAIYAVVVVAALEHIVRYQPHLLQFASGLLPELLVVSLIAFATMVLLRPKS